jgi:hypothetical protein
VTATAAAAVHWELVQLVQVQQWLLQVLVHSQLELPLMHL